MSDHGHDPSSQVRTYLTIFGCLGVLTLLTVGVAYLDLPQDTGLVVAILIAAMKVTLIGGFFMHLLDEGKLINYSLAVAVALVVMMITFVMPDVGVHPNEEAEREHAMTPEEFFEAMGVEDPRGHH